MTTIMLIRHGENDYVKKGLLAGRLEGVHLNQRGREQAQNLASHLAGVPIKAIYSSPLERAIETAEPIAQSLGLEINLYDGLIEVDIGDWQNQRIKNLNRSKPWKVVQNMPSRASFPGGETMIEAQLRISMAIERLATEHDPKDLIACVTHADPIKLAVAYFIGLPIDFFQRLSVAPASMTLLQVNDSSSRLIALNYEISFSLSKN